MYNPVCMVHSLDIRTLLECVRGRFLTDVDAQHIASEACYQRIITEEHETSIREAKSKKKANEILYEHLCRQATKDTLEKLCRIMTEDEAYAKMREFGQMLQQKVSIFGYWIQVGCDLLNWSCVARHNQMSSCHIWVRHLIICELQLLC